MVQKEKSKAVRGQHEDRDEVPSEVNETSAQASEDAACCLAEIDNILAEVVTEEPKPEWEQEFDPNGSRPNRSEWLKEFHRIRREVSGSAAYEFWYKFTDRETQWHEVRGLVYNSCVC